MRAMIVAVGIFALAACSPGDTKKVEPQAEAPVPAAVALETFTGCTWGEVKGAALSIWSFACGPDKGNFRLVADDALPGFAIEGPGEGGAMARRTVVQIFAKPAEAGIEAILPAVHAASPETPGAACTLQPAESGVPGFYAFGPTGKLGEAWRADQFSDTLPATPCGPMGVGPAGERLFSVMDGHPDKVVYADYGSEIQIFDVGTLKATDAH